MMSRSAGRGSTASLTRARAKPQAERVSAAQSRLRSGRAQGLQARGNRIYRMTRTANSVED